jgi:hypothetical protein
VTYTASKMQQQREEGGSKRIKLGRWYEESAKVHELVIYRTGFGEILVNVMSDFQSQQLFFLYEELKLCGVFS